MTDEHEQGRKHSQPWCLTHDAPMVCSAGDVERDWTCCCEHAPAWKCGACRSRSEAAPHKKCFRKASRPADTHPHDGLNLAGLLDQACRLLGRASFFGFPSERFEGEVEAFLDVMQVRGFGIQPVPSASAGQTEVQE